MKWTEKRMFEKCLRDMPHTTDQDKTWSRLKKLDLTDETEGSIYAAQEQVLRLNYIRHHIDGKAEPLLCRLCEIENETANHTLCECSKIAERNHKRENTLKVQEKYQMERKVQWYSRKKEQ